MIAIISKLWDIVWDMWQHRNHITYNTVHPKKQLELDRIGQKVEELYEQGSTELLPRDRPLFLKSLAALKKGNGNEQEQWVTSVILAKQRAATAKADINASMTTKRSLVASWLGIIHEKEE
jgi:hypothetical protein